MIKASELRIGNIVWESSSFTPGPYDFEQIVVGAINDIDKVVLDNQNNIYSYDYLYPISLTPEWLERCGLELRKEDKIWQIQVGNTSYLEIEAEEPFMCGVTPETWRDLCPIYIWNEIKHVHQLQNIYFALTGEELTIKE